MLPAFRPRRCLSAAGQGRAVRAGGGAERSGAGPWRAGAAAGSGRGRPGAAGPGCGPMWLQQRLKGLPGLLSSSWARRVLVLAAALLAAYWWLGRRGLGGGAGAAAARGGAAGLCLQAEARGWRALAERGEALPLPLPGAGAEGPPALVGNGFVVLDAGVDRLWVTAGAELVRTELALLVQLAAPGSPAEARAAVAALREGAVRRVRCLALGPGAECVTVREELVAHRRRPHLLLQRLHVANPGERLAAFEAARPGARWAASSLEKAGDRQFVLSSARVPLPGSPKVVALAVAAQKLPSRVQVAPRSHFEETLLSVVHVSEPLEPSRLDEALSQLWEAAKKEMLEVMEVGADELLQEHRQTWADLFISGEGELEAAAVPCETCRTRETSTALALCLESFWVAHHVVLQGHHRVIKWGS